MTNCKVGEASGPYGGEALGAVGGRSDSEETDSDLLESNTTNNRGSSSRRPTVLTSRLDLVLERMEYSSLTYHPWGLLPACHYFEGYCGRI